MKDLLKKFRKGDSVEVNTGVMDTLMEGLSIAGWQGRVMNIKTSEGDDVLLKVEWDSVTLEDMPAEYIQTCEDQGYDWATYTLYAEDVEKAEERDTAELVEEAQNSIRVDLTILEEQEERIAAVLKEANEDDLDACLTVWLTHLSENLSFPFGVSLLENYEGFHEFAKLQVLSLGKNSKNEGIIAMIKQGKSEVKIPLFLLEVSNENSDNFALVDDYAMWFSAMIQNEDA